MNKPHFTDLGRAAELFHWIQQKRWHKLAFAKKIANFLINDVMRYVHDHGIDFKEFANRVSPQECAKLCALEELHGQMRRKVLEKMATDQQTCDQAMRELKIEEVDSDDLKHIAADVCQANPKAVTDYRSGKKKAIGALIGQVMAKTKGQASPNKVRTVLESLLQGTEPDND